ncbi:MAG: DNA repair protein RecO [Candidatus Bipolaricaulaceae bacterium]
MAELVRDRGLVLHAQDHAETDRIVTALCAQHGLMEILAKGARRLERTWGAALDLLNLAELIYYRRRTGLHLLREASILQTFPKVKGELVRLEAGLALAQWANDLIPREVPDPRVFRLTLRFLSALEDGGTPEVLLRAYRLRLLSLLGYRPILSGCLSCGKREGLTWSAERGGLLCRECGGTGEEVPPRVWRAMEAMLRLPVAALSRLQLPETDLAAIDALLQGFRETQVLG